MWPPAGWHWINARPVVEGTTWGGNLEIVSWLLQAGFGRAERAVRRLRCLVLETSEEMPSADEVFRILRNHGRARTAATVPGASWCGRPKALGPRLLADLAPSAARRGGTGVPGVRPAGGEFGVTSGAPPAVDHPVRRHVRVDGAAGCSDRRN